MFIIVYEYSSTKNNEIFKDTQWTNKCIYPFDPEYDVSHDQICGLDFPLASGINPEPATLCNERNCLWRQLFGSRHLAAGAEWE